MTDDDHDHDSGDAAAEAFEGVRAEVALLRRAVERLAAERGEVAETVDYSETLGRIVAGVAATAQRVDLLAKSPALAMTPAQIAGQIAAAGSEARRGDAQLVAEARKGLDQAARQLAGMAATVRRADDQKRWLIWTGVGGAAIGMALWATLAGPIARAVPASWHWPARMAARTLALPMWEAGQRMMATAAPGEFEAMVAGDRIVMANRETIEGCRKVAAKTRDIVRCTVRVGAEP